MSILKIASAFPLVVGIAFASPGTQSQTLMLAAGGPSDTSSGSASEPSGGGGAMGSGGSSESLGAAPEPGGSSGGSASGTGSTPSGSSAMGSSGEARGDQWVHGKVSKVSKDQITITPKGGEARTLEISDQTEITVNGRTAKASQLKKGQAVRASYSSEGGQEVATKIMVGRARQARGHTMKGMGGSSGSESGGGK